MKTEYFKMIGQKTGDKLVLIAVVDPLMLGEIPSIFEVQAFKVPETIYTGAYPTIKINTSSIKDITEEMKGMGVNGIITKSDWYNKTVINDDVYGISIKPAQS